MAKAPEPRKKQPAGPEHADRPANSGQIAEIDRQIAALIQQRAEVVKTAASPMDARAVLRGSTTDGLKALRKRQSARCRKLPFGPCFANS